MAGATSTATRDMVKVYLRIRPPLGKEIDHGFAVGAVDKSTVHFDHDMYGVETFAMDRVFSSYETQDVVFQHVQASILNAIKGYNATVFAYGQTGTGKTYTMVGPNPDVVRGRGESDGITSRAVDLLFGILRARGHNYSISLSYFEVYNEKVYDLISASATRKREPLDVRESAGGVFIQGITEIEVASSEDVLYLFSEAAKQRTMRSTEMNVDSSRSHCIFRLNIVQNVNGTILRSKVNLVDLAGSEKWNVYNKMDGAHQSELTAINQSLSALGHCISALIQSGRRHIPYRDSKLTRILQDSIGGRAKTIFIATVSPSELCAEESLSTLKFADRAKNIEVKAVANMQKPLDAQLAAAKKEIKSLEKELAEERRLHQVAKGAEREVPQLLGRMTSLNEEILVLRQELNSTEAECNELKSALQLKTNAAAPPSSTQQKNEIELEALKAQNHFLQMQVRQKSGVGENAFRLQQQVHQLTERAERAEVAKKQAVAEIERLTAKSSDGALPEHLAVIEHLQRAVHTYSSDDMVPREIVDEALRILARSHNTVQGSTGHVGWAGPSQQQRPTSSPNLLHLSPSPPPTSAAQVTANLQVAPKLDPPPPPPSWTNQPRQNTATAPAPSDVIDLTNSAPSLHTLIHQGRSRGFG